MCFLNMCCNSAFNNYWIIAIFSCNTPLFPKKPIVFIFLDLANFNTLIIFLDFPDVDMAIRMSFFLML